MINIDCQLNRTGNRLWDRFGLSVRSYLGQPLGMPVMDFLKSDLLSICPFWYLGFLGYTDWDGKAPLGCDVSHTFWWQLRWSYKVVCGGKICFLPACFCVLCMSLSILWLSLFQGHWDSAFSASPYRLKTSGPPRILLAFSIRLELLRHPALRTGHLLGSQPLQCAGSHCWIPGRYWVNQANTTPFTMYQFYWFFSSRALTDTDEYATFSCNEQ